MKQLFPLVLLLAAGCSEPTTTTADKKDSQPKVDTSIDRTPRITGIGGVFFKCKDPAAMKEWYSENFGMSMNEYGALFEFRNTDQPDRKGYLQWSPFNDKTTYFDKEYMINYRVEGIEALVEQLKQKGATVVDSIQSYDYGKFVHVMDPEGNKIELWEPVDTPFTKEYEGTTVH